MALKGKYCPNCDTIKSVDEFYDRLNIKNGKRSYCKFCMSKMTKETKQTKIGLINTIYRTEIENSIKRGYKLPKYNLQELQVWALSQDIFHKLYNKWIKSGFATQNRPSFDRTNDYKRYNLKRLQIVTWEENREKYNQDRINGVNTKNSKSVISINKKTGKEQSYYSINQAIRETGVDGSDIVNCCKGLKHRKSAGGFVWKYS
jgi:hypothetical protein